MDAKQLQAIEERWAKPWAKDWKRFGGCVYQDALTAARCLNSRHAETIASAPTDIAALLEEVRRLRCCGNCKQYIPHCQEGYKPYDKCDEWEAADNG